MTLRIAAAPMTAAAIPPSTRKERVAMYGPMTEGLEAQVAITAISGTATTPVITAL